SLKSIALPVTDVASALRAETRAAGSTLHSDRIAKNCSRHHQRIFPMYRHEIRGARLVGVSGHPDLPAAPARSEPDVPGKTGLSGQQRKNLSAPVHRSHRRIENPATLEGRLDRKPFPARPDSSRTRWTHPSDGG